MQQITNTDGTIDVTETPKAPTKHQIYYYYASNLIGGALSDDAVWCLSV